MKKMFTLFIFAVFCFVKGWAQAPENDECSTAIDLGCGQVYSGNNANAPNTLLTTSDCRDYLSNVVWFRYTATGSGNVTFTQSHEINPLDISTYWYSELKYYTGSCSQLTCTYNTGSTLAVTSGTTYYIAMTAYGASTVFGSAYTFSATCDYFNDSCADAKPLACGQTITGDNTNATDEVLPPSSCGLPTEGITKGVWYKYSADATGLVTFSTVGGAAWDTYLRVFSGTCDSLSCVGFNDDYNGTQSQVSVPVTSGQTYYVLLGGWSSNQYGAYSLTATCCTQPTITGISGGGTFCTNSDPADLSVTTTGTVTSYDWYFNTTNSTTGGEPVGIYPTQPILTNLVGTRYYYVVVSGGCGSDTSATQMVTINQAPTSATLSAQQTEICYGSQIQVSATAQSGVKPYTYNYINAATQDSSGFVAAKNRNEPAGQYYVTVKDANGCSINSLPLTITQPASPISLTTKTTGGICGGGGSVQVSATGGYGDFVYSIDTSSHVLTITPGTFQNVSPGRHVIVAYDAHGCTGTKVVTVGNTNKVPAPTGFTGPTMVEATSVTTYRVDSVNNVSYAWAVPFGAVVVSGQGTATASIKWGYKSGKIKITPSSSCGTGAAKQYSITVTHANSFESNVITNTVVKPGNGISVYPNPTRDMATLQFTSTGEAKYVIDVTDMRGKQILHKEGAVVRGTNQVKLDLRNVANGVYFIRLSDGKTVQTIKLVKGQ